MFHLMSKGKRINRATYWTIIVCAFLLILFLHRISIIFSIAALVASAKRSRDFGWPGWVPPAFAGALFGLLVGAIAPYADAIHQHPNDLATAAPGVTAIIGVYVLLTLVMTVVVGCIPGTPGVNKFGPPPKSGVGKGVEDDRHLASVFGDAAQSIPATRATPANSPAPGYRGSDAAAAYNTAAVSTQPMRGGFGRKGL